ncbi:hypothetical protein Tco_1006475 [Tanacetum coccineum]|uniref:Uncharacterized protein n=1 Tax=Tanacetum coccineum TaxID=301880 RepID=A0ABQ5FI24_9ASTR
MGFARDIHALLSSATSVCTYTFVYTDSKPDRAFWGADDEEVSKGGIPRVIVLGYDGTPATASSPTITRLHTNARESTDTHQLPQETMSFPAEEQLHYILSIHQLLSHRNSYRVDSRGGTKEYEDDEDRGSVRVSLFVPTEGTNRLLPPPSTDITIGARITVRPQTSISLPPEAEVERLLTMTTPSPSPPISLSPPSARERLARIASTQVLIDAVTAALPPPPLPPLPPSLYIPPPVDRRDDIPESEQPPRKRLYLSTLGSRYEVGESSTARPTRGQGIDYGFVSTVDAEERRQGIRDVGYGIRDTWVDSAEAVPKIAPMTVGEVNTRVTELAELHEHDTQDLYALLEDAQDSWPCISQRVDMD